ncbi:18222_t:CDS:2 [Gigaspora rosea]|nr:18222_t:CDS:2 [Gigaspora rosea]
MEIELVPHFSTTISVEPTLEILVNATAQRKIADEIDAIKKKFSELKQICEITTDIRILRRPKTQVKGQKVLDDFYLLPSQRSSQIDTIDEILFELRDSISDEEL